jgi:hypothetical protein
MATQIVISNKDAITLDDEMAFKWEDKGKNWDDSWLPDTIHYVVWNSLGPNEIQNKDASTNNMTGNTPLTSTSDVVGNTTIADLLTWGETRRLQIEEALMNYEVALNADIDNGTTEAEGKSWRDYDPHYS